MEIHTGLVDLTADLRVILLDLINLILLLFTIIFKELNLALNLGDGLNLRVVLVQQIRKTVFRLGFRIWNADTAAF